MKQKVINSVNPQGQSSYPSLIDVIGKTPLVEVPLNLVCPTLAKLEYLNPGGSVKDRSALFMIQEAEQKGWLKPGGTIIDASSGNQGIALAIIGAQKGYNVIITISEKISIEKKKTLLAYGATIVTCPVTDRIDDPEGYHSKAVEIHKNTPNSFMPNQYFNLSNPKAHETMLAPEIWQQTNGMITHFFAAAGTGGTISGVGTYLKKMNPTIKVIAVDSCNSYRSTNGHPKRYNLEGIGVDFISPVLDVSVIDQFITVSDQEAFTALQSVAKKGFLVGPSSGAVAAAVKKYTKKLAPHDILVMIFGDSGRAYLSKDFY
ncbi:MAG: cysteine synthase family protein [Candidatus Babeliales bacterium]